MVDVTLSTAAPRGAAARPSRAAASRMDVARPSFSSPPPQVQGPTNFCATYTSMSANVPGDTDRHWLGLYQARALRPSGLPTRTTYQDYLPTRTQGCGGCYPLHCSATRSSGSPFASSSKPRDVGATFPTRFLWVYCDCRRGRCVWRAEGVASGAHQSVVCREAERPQRLLGHLLSGRG